MKLITQRVAILLLTGIVIFVAVQTVQARRWFRVDASNYVDITQPCKDGAVFRIARDGASEELNQIRTVAGTSLVPTTQLTLSANPVTIGSESLSHSEIFTKTWSGSQTLTPGTRFYLELNEQDSQLFHATVKDCTINPVDLSPDPYVAVAPEITQDDFNGGTINAGSTVTFTVSTGITETIGDVDVAMYLYNDLPGDFTPMDITAWVQSPEGTKVNIMDGWTEGGDNFGTRCRLDNQGLVGDPTADFILDDESGFKISDVLTAAPFNDTALQPANPLKPFDGESPTGDWKLIIQNDSTSDAFLRCWFVKLAADETSKLFLPSIIREVILSQKSVKITGITQSTDKYHATFVTTGFTPQLPGEHIHFYFNTITEGNAGVPGTGPWKIYGLGSPFTQYGPADAGAATEMCAIVANIDHTIKPGTGNCYPLP